MSNNLYEILWVGKTATKDEIKKAYRKKAMEHHPDRNKWNKDSEEMFKKVNEAYDILSDDNKKKQYDMFGSTSNSNPFGWATGWNYYSSNPFWAWWFSWFEDLFWNMWAKWWSSSSFEFNLEDLFWDINSQSNSKRRTTNKKTEEKKEETLDFEKTYEVPIFDLIIWCKIEVTGVYGQKAKLTIPANTKPWTKFRVKDFWKSEANKKWNLIIKIEAKMPKTISDVDLQMLKTIRDNVGY